MTTAQQQVKRLLEFIDASPSPWHAVVTVQEQLQAAKFVQLYETEKWILKSGGRYFVVRDDSSIVVFIYGKQPLQETGFKIIGAHTDSPGLRIKPRSSQAAEGVLRLGVEVYGGAIVATFSDRDLSLAGRISYRDAEEQIKTRLVTFTRPLLRLPNLAIHMNRTVNEDGLKFHKQNELPLIFSQTAGEQLPQDLLLSLLQEQSSVDTKQILSWELNAYDTQKGAVWGANKEFYADSQLDNLASCHAALTALLQQSSLQKGATLVAAFFDHEEIGSESVKGADGSFLPDILERIALAKAIGREDYHRALAKSFMISADMAHAYQPNFPTAYEAEHKVFVNQGPVIKINSNHRYTSESISEAMFANWCEQTKVPFQKYCHRTDIPCGSTIGPMASAKLGIRTVDVGSPMWAMHSIRESAGVLDHDYMIRVMSHFYAS